MMIVQLIAWKEGKNCLLVDPEEIGCLQKLSELNEDAHSVFELYPNSDTKCGSYSFWDNAVMCQSRAAMQQHLKAAIQKIESPAVSPTSPHS